MTPPDTPPAPQAPLTPSTASAQAAARRPRRVWPWLLAGGALVAVTLVAAPIALLRTEGGSRWLLSQVPGLGVTGLQGRLAGDLDIEQLTWRDASGATALTVDGLSWRGMALSLGSRGEGPPRGGPPSVDPPSPRPTGPWAWLRLTSVSARTVTWSPGPSASAAPAPQPPAHLRLPVAVQVDTVSVGEIRAAALGDQALRQFTARVTLGADEGARHRIDQWAMGFDRWQASGSLSIGADAPMPVQAQVQLHTAPGATGAWAGWRAQADLTGPLSGPDATVSIDQPSGRLLDARAQLRPFAPWPLGDLSLRTDGLDLAGLVASAPRTALSGTATVRSSGLDADAQLDLQLDNAAAGRWNEGRVPVRRLQAQASLRPDTLDRLTLHQLDAELGSADAAAGRLGGKAQLADGRWSVQAQLTGVQPQRLDARAPAMTLTGPVTASGTRPGGTPASPGLARPPFTAQLKAQIDGVVDDLPGRGKRPVQLAVDGGLSLADGGRLQVDLRDATARAGAQSARLSGRLGRASASTAWQVLAEGRWDDIDPATWWPGAATIPASGPGTARRAAQRLSGEVKADLSWLDSDPTTPRPADRGAKGPSSAPRSASPAVPAADPWQSLGQALAPLRGSASFTLAPSTLAGLALSGDGRLDARGPRPGAVALEARLAVKAGVNRVDATLTSQGNRPADDRADVTLDATDLRALAPLLGMANGLGMAPGGGGKPVALSGRVVGRAGLRGRWPQVEVDGRLEARGLQVAGLSLQQGDLRWQAGSSASAPVDVKADLTGLVASGQTADRVSLLLTGTARAHTLSLDADSAALPPAWLATLDGPAAAGASGSASRSGTAGNGGTAGGAGGVVGQTSAPAFAAGTGSPSPSPAPSQIRLKAQGGLQFDGGNAGTAGSVRSSSNSDTRDRAPAALAATGWRGQLQVLQVRSGRQGEGQVALSARDIPVTAGWGSAGTSVSAEPGRVDLQAGTTRAALRWTRLGWRAATPAAGGQAARAMQVDVDADLEPLAVAPLLARFQPEFGWGGDLSIGGRLQVRSTPALSADIVIERRAGDLKVTDEVGTQVLGLTDLRLALTANNGVWSFTQALAGTSVGVAAGAVVARTGSPTAWPDASTPIQGVVELRVAKLGTWSPWVPAGWRLGGALTTSANLGGRLGAPEYTGSLRGSDISVRNFAEGVNVTDGDIDIRLQGATARIERFTAKVGDGTVALSGNATFGTAPEARLALVAKRFQLLGRVDRRIVASGEGELQLGANKVALNGRFGVDEGLIDFTRGDAPSLASDVEVVRAPAGRKADAATPAEARAAGRFDPKADGTKPRPGEAGGGGGGGGGGAGSSNGNGQGANAATAPARPPSRAVALNLVVQLGDRLRLRGRGLDTGLQGELRITSPGGRMAVNGTVSTVGGNFAAYGQKLSIDRGSVIFTGAVENPRLDIEATRPNTDVRVGVVIGGTASNPRIRLFSEPELAEVDKLSWLVLGRASDGLGRTDTALLQRAALALLAGDGSGGGGVTDQLTKAIGLDDVAVRQTEGEVRETVVSLGKQLSRRWYVGYERGLNATAGNWQLIYRIAQRFTLRAQSGTENSLDVIWTWRWQ